jgi:alkylated DNA repair dioxygenase AlkB
VGVIESTDATGSAAALWPNVSEVSSGRRRAHDGGMDASPPPGFRYAPDVVTSAEERRLVEGMRGLAWQEVKMRGQVARRRTVHFGWLYGYETSRIEPGPPLPDFLLPLRERAGTLAGVAPDALVEVLVTEYAPGAGIGWHRDAPMFGDVVGVSLLSPCRFRFQRGTGTARETRAVAVEPRSAYVMAGSARWQWQHSIPPMKAWRYSVTFRTLKASP